MNEDEDFKDEKGVALVDVKEDVEINEKVSFSIFSRWNDSLLGTIKNIYLHFGLWDCHYSNLNANIVFLPYKAFKAQTISDRLYIENAIGKGDAAKIRLEGQWFLEMLHETGQWEKNCFYVRLYWGLDNKMGFLLLYQLELHFYLF